MEASIYTGREETMLKIMVRTKGNKPRKIRLIVSDEDMKNTVLTDRYNVFNGIQTFFVRMPLSPKKSLIKVYDEEVGNRAYRKETNFEMVNEDGERDDINYGIYRLPLEKNMAEVDMKNPDVKRFVTFAEKFCYNAGWLNAGKYVSDDGKMQFNYMPTIYRDGGQESGTPARISERTKIIDISQKIFIPFTVPMRFAILCHEFAHCYLNEQPENEIEADLQGLNLYLSLGFPHIEAYHAFLDVFMGTRTSLNARRYDMVHQFITDYRNLKTVYQ